MKKRLTYNVLFRPETEGGFTALVPSLPGCVTYGKDLQEARRMAVDAIGGYIKSLKKHNEPIVSDEALKKRAVVPYHLRDIPKGTLSSLLSEAGISRDDFLGKHSTKKSQN